MKLILLLVLIFISANCASTPYNGDETVGAFRIIAQDKSPRTLLLGEDLKNLIKKMNLAPYSFRHTFFLKEKGHPNSPPGKPFIVLTSMSPTTDYMASPEILLAAVIHEEIHEFLDQKKSQKELAILKIKRVWPVEKIPTDKSAIGDNLDSAYDHLIICYLEFFGLKHFSGDTVAENVISNRKTYTWVYQTVLRNQSVLHDILLETGLLFPQ